MLGPYSSGLTVAIAPVTEQYQIPMVEGQGATRSLFNKGYKYLFAPLSTSEQYLASTIALAAEKAEEQGKDPSEVKVAMAYENDPFSQDVRAGVLADMEKYGMQAVIDDQLPRDLSDMAATLTKVKALQPDVLLVSGHEKGAATAVRQIGEMDIHVPIIAVTHCESADITNAFAEPAEGILCPTQWAETMKYEDSRSSAAPQISTRRSRRRIPNTPTARCLTSLPRARSRSSSSRTPSSGPARLTRRRSATPWPRPT